MENLENLPKIAIQLIDLKHTNHSNKRASQRGITLESIKIAMFFSESYFKQNVIFHVVKESLLPENISEKIKKRIKNLVVIVSGNSNEIITCYRDKNALRTVKLKVKENRKRYKCN
jgi:hypothetical protein